VWEETGKGRRRLKAHEHFAEPGVSQTVLDFLSSTDVGRTVLAVEEKDVESEVSEWELRESAEREEERRAEERRIKDEREEEHQQLLYPRRRSWQWQIQSRGRLGLLVSGFISFLISLVRFHTIWDTPGRRAKGCLHCAASRGSRRGIGLYIWVHAPRHDLTRSHTSNE